MSPRTLTAAAAATLSLGIGIAWASLVVPTDVQQPGTQPREVSGLETPDKCDNCHGNYNTSVEPAYNWRGSMMAQAGRDPLFWATLAVAEQDFDGAGDLCIRCHSPEGWIGGRSTPTDGSGLLASDGDGVTCDLCHKMTNPDKSEWFGVQNSPFLAFEGSPIVGYYGSGQYVLWGGAEKLGPYSDATARHQALQSRFHRSRDYCGTCHDVSNPVTGDLAPRNGAPAPLAAGTYSGTPGTPVDGKAAFNNAPFRYGVVERTYSEYKSGLLSSMKVSDYALLPADLKAGAIKTAYDTSIVAGTGGNYEDTTTRYFGCQTCHMRPVTGQGCNKNPAVRRDLPLHDMTGGNVWVPDAIKYLNSLGRLRLGNGMTSLQLAALDAGKTRAMKQLSEAAALSVNGNIAKIVNLTGHKLISGYPEGRRMWLDIKWYAADGALLRADGQYGPITVNLDGAPVQVDSILDLNGTNTRIWQAHNGITPAWAQRLVGLGLAASTPVTYDRASGEITSTLGQVAAGTSPHESFHFVLNDTSISDNRIPPYGMSYDEAQQRNALPVPPTQFGVPGPGGRYNYWDEVALNPPGGAAWATIELKYQSTSWEYVQFLYLANRAGNVFLAAEGMDLLEAWRSTGMAAPYVMARATWGTPPVVPATRMRVDSLKTWSVSKSGALVAESSSFNLGATVAVRAHVADDANAPLSGAQVFIDIHSPAGALITSLQGFTDTNGYAVTKWTTARSLAAGSYSARVKDIQKSGYQFDTTTGIQSVTFTLQ